MLVRAAVAVAVAVAVSLSPSSSAWAFVVPPRRLTSKGRLSVPPTAPRMPTWRGGPTGTRNGARPPRPSLDSRADADAGAEGGGSAPTGANAPHPNGDGSKTGAGPRAGSRGSPAVVAPPSSASSEGDAFSGSTGAAAAAVAAEDSAPLAMLKERLFLGIDPTPEIIAIMTIYFVEGALGLARLAQTFLLKDTLHLGPAEMSALTGAFALPWTIKPLYGFLSDGFPLFGYRRRSYLVLAGLLGCLSYSALGADFWGLLSSEPTIPFTEAAAVSTATSAATAASSAMSRSDLQWTVAALTLSSACIAVSDVVADGIVVQRTRDSDDPRVAGGLQSLCWGSASLGALVTAYFSGSLLETIGPRGVFAITAVLPLSVAAIAALIDEKPAAASSDDDGSALATVKEQVGDLWDAIKEPSIWKPALFLFLWQSTPTGEGAMLYFMTEDLGFGPEFLGRVRFVAAVSSLVGVWVYQKYLRTVPVKTILFWTSLASAPLGLSNLLLITHANRALGIPDGAFVFGDDVALSILGELAFLPTLVLAARLCPPGVEAVLFATLMSVFNGASTVGTELGAALTKFLGVTESNFDNLGLLTVICNVSSLYPLLFIGLLDGVGSKSAEEMESMLKPVELDVAASPDNL